jgi:hypothetical protein
MKNILKLSLAAVAIAALSACGGGGSEDPADKYVGTWLGKCNSYTGSDGATYYRKLKRVLTKLNAGQLTGKSTQEGAYSDAVCSKSVSSAVTTFSGGTQYNIGKTVTILGAEASEIASIDLGSNAALPGYMTVSNGQWYIATYDPSKGETTITGWSANSPYTKQ